MITKLFFLVSLFKGLDSYPKPLFWGILYTVFLVTIDYMWSLAGGASVLPILGLIVLNFAVATGVFTALRELGDGLPYWATLIVGTLLLAWLP